MPARQPHEGGVRALASAPDGGALAATTAFVPPAKELARRVTLAVARETAEQVLRLETAAEVREYLTRKTREVWPDGSRAET